VEPDGYELTYAVPGCRISREAGGRCVLRGLRLACIGPTAIPAPSFQTLLLAAGAEVIPPPQGVPVGQIDGSGPTGAVLVQQGPDDTWQSHSEATVLDAIMRGYWNADVDKQRSTPEEELAAAVQAGPFAAFQTAGDCVPPPSDARDVENASPQRHRDAPATSAPPVASASAPPPPTPPPPPPPPRPPPPTPVDVASAVAGEDRRASKRARAAIGHTRTPLPLDCGSPRDSGGSGLRAELLPTCTAQEAGGGSYFLGEDALRLYRTKLPDCDVMLPAEPLDDALGEGGGGEGDPSSRPQRRHRRHQGGGSRQGRARGGGGAHTRDFLRELLEVDGARTAVLLRDDGGEAALLGACTYVHHPSEGLCELFLLATRHAKRGHGTLLLRAVERHLQGASVRCIICLAGEDTLSFWQKKGYTQEAVALKPQWWALLRDPFGSSKLTAKWLVGGPHVDGGDADSPGVRSSRSRKSSRL
jgi:GNAT superfamily N-acetyltransferase